MYFSCSFFRFFFPFSLPYFFLVLSVRTVNNSCRTPFSNLIALQEFLSSLCPTHPVEALQKAFLYHHLENQIPGYFFLGPFIPNLILFVTLWCRRRYFPHPTQWRYLLRHVTCVTYLGMGGSLLCLSVK
jgi:hypothetical protein